MDAIEQKAFLSIAPIIPGREPELEKIFDYIVDNDVETNDLVPFKQIESIHFARWAILPASEDTKGRKIGPQLMFSTNYDEPLDEHLHEVATKGAKGLDQIYRHCEGYPTNPDVPKRIAYLQKYFARYHTFYVGTVGRTVKQIHEEDELRREIQVFLSTRSWQGVEPAVVRQAIQQHIDGKPEFSWAKQPPPPRYTKKVLFIEKNFNLLLTIALLILLGVLFLPAIAGWVSWWVPFVVLLVLAVAALLFVVRLRHLEETDAEDPMDYSCPELQQLSSAEDHVVQNQMTSILNLKPGFVRLTTERLVQAVINFTARYFSNKGSLAGIPSIHFARWAIVDDDRRLLFLSNFDGSWENYLGDFIDKAADGLTAVWSNCVGFPKTKWLFKEGGARDEQRFKSYARKSQVPTQVFYTAYKTLTVQNIQNSSLIREGLYGEQTEAETREWLGLF